MWRREKKVTRGYVSSSSTLKAFLYVQREKSRVFWFAELTVALFYCRCLLKLPCLLRASRAAAWKFSIIIIPDGRLRAHRWFFACLRPDLQSFSSPASATRRSILQAAWDRRNPLRDRKLTRSALFSSPSLVPWPRRPFLMPRHMAGHSSLFRYTWVCFRDLEVVAENVRNKAPRFMRFALSQGPGSAQKKSKACLALYDTHFFFLEEFLFSSIFFHVSSYSFPFIVRSSVTAPPLYPFLPYCFPPPATVPFSSLFLTSAGHQRTHVRTRHEVTFLCQGHFSTVLHLRRGKHCSDFSSAYLSILSFHSLQYVGWPGCRRKNVLFLFSSLLLSRVCTSHESYLKGWGISSEQAKAGFLLR